MGISMDFRSMSGCRSGDGYMAIFDQESFTTKTLRHKDTDDAAVASFRIVKPPIDQFLTRALVFHSRA